LQLFRPDINTAHFYFFVAEVLSNYLTTYVLKKISVLLEAPLKPEARGICHIGHMVNPALPWPLWDVRSAKSCSKVKTIEQQLL